MFKQLFLELWGVTVLMAPFLLLGFVLAGLLSVWVSSSFVERHLGRKGWLQSAKAALLGVPLPLCSCGVIPVAASLRRHGAGKGATVSFLTSTPQTGIDSILATFSLLGPLFTFLRVVAAFFSGFVGGVAVDWLDGRDEHAAPEYEEGHCGSCAADHGHGRFYQALHYGLVVLPGDIGRAVLLGLLVAGVMGALVPEDFFAGSLGDGWSSLLVMLLLGIPMYVCSTASIPVAFSLIQAGISPGGALVFLIAGPATNAATVSTIWKVLGRRSTLIYLLSIAVTALISGSVVDLFISGDVLRASGGTGHRCFAWYEHVAAGVLLLVLLASQWPRRRDNDGHADLVVNIEKTGPGLRGPF